MWVDLTFTSAHRNVIHRNIPFNLVIYIFNSTFKHGPDNSIFILFLPNNHIFTHIDFATLLLSELHITSTV